MALTLLSAPGLGTRPRLDFTKNGVVWKIQTDNRVTDAGSKYRLDLYFSEGSSIAAGQTLTFTFDNNTVLMTAAVAPDGTGKQFITGAITASYMSTLLFSLCSNYLLYKYYNIEYTGKSGNNHVIRLTAREVGLKYSISFSKTVAAVVSTGYSPAFEKTLRINYKLILEVYLLSGSVASNNYTHIGTLEQAPDTSETCTFDVSELIDAYCSVDLPVYNQSNITECLKNSRAYFVRYGEKYGDPEVVQKMYLFGNDLPCFAISGGISKEQYPTHTLFSGSKFYLTNQPRSKYITRTQHEFLYLTNWLYDSNIAISLVANIVYNDGSTASYTAKQYNTTNIKYRSFLLPVGFSQLNLAQQETLGRKIVSYTISVYAMIAFFPQDITPDVRTYYVEDSTSYTERQFLIYNSLGGVDTIRTNGGYIKGIEADYEVYQKPVLHGYTAREPEVYKSDIVYDKVYEVSTGYLYTEQEKNYLQELLLARAVWEIKDDKYISIIILSKKEELFTSRDTIWALKFEYKYSYTNSVYGSL